MPSAPKTPEERALAAGALLQKLAGLTDEAAEKVLGRRKGFILFLFDFGEALAPEVQEMHYVSNAEREDACTALAEYLMTQAPEVLQAMIARVQAQQIHGPEHSH